MWGKQNCKQLYTNWGICKNKNGAKLRSASASSLPQAGEPLFFFICFFFFFFNGAVGEQKCIDAITCIIYLPSLRPPHARAKRSTCIGTRPHDTHSVSYCLRERGGRRRHKHCHLAVVMISQVFPPSYWRNVTKCNEKTFSSTGLSWVFGLPGNDFLQPFREIFRSAGDLLTLNKCRCHSHVVLAQKIISKLIW